MPNCLTVACPTHRLLPGRAPVSYSLLIQSRLRAMDCKNLGLRIDEFWKFSLQGRGNSVMELPPAAAQQRPVGRVLHERVLEQISRVRRNSSAEQESRLDETFQRRRESGVALRGDGQDQLV